MLTLVGAGYGIGFAIASQVQTLQRPDISIRPLAGSPPVLSTYLLRRRGEPSEPMKRFIERAKGGRDRAAGGVTTPREGCQRRWDARKVV